MFIWSLALLGCGTSHHADDLGSCIPEDLPPPQLRLLTRAEYAQTVQDLLPTGGVDGAVCSDDTDCDLSSQSCVGQTCLADPCELVTFMYPTSGPHQSVHIAGSFNGWPPTIAEGGWPMTWVPEVGAYVAKQAIPDGDHTYKFVIDESNWVADPNNPSTTDDGFGGVNSVLNQACSNAPEASASTADITAGFPVESRPSAYPFDNHADSGLVTAVHVEQYGRAARELATRIDTRDLLGCEPSDATCVRSWVTSFGKRAFRRPLTSEEIERYVGLVNNAPDADTGVQVAIRVILQSPNFLYRFEIGEESADGVRRLDAWERASALSYTFWGTSPDDALMQAADNGQLDTPEGIEAQARRLLEHPRARAHLGRFALQWLGVENAGTLIKHEGMHPEWNAQLGASLVQSTRDTFTHVLFDGDRDFETLMTGSIAVGDASVARLYGAGSPDANGVFEMPAERPGLLGHGSVLARYAHSNESSPILRGLFVRSRLLCEPELTPPGDIPALPEVDGETTTRNRLEQHTQDPTCAGCHDRIDPVGFAFENFDAIGAWRDTDAGQPIDTTGVVLGLDGADAEVDGLNDLALALAGSDRARRCFVTQVWRFAHGRLEDDFRSCALEEADAWFAQSDGDLQEALIAITQTPGFTARSAGGAQ